MKVIKVIILILLVAVESVLGQHSQNKLNSPYSAYGLGNLKGRNVNIVQKAMGGLSIGWSSSQYINPNNAASPAVYDSMRFVFETALTGEYGTLSSLNAMENSSSLTLNYLLMGFPVTKWWGSSLGLIPYSEIGYNIDVTIDMSQYNFSNIIYNLEGEGRFNTFYWGNGFKITKNLRAGVNTNVLFGNAEFTKLIFFPDSMFILNTRTTKEYHMADINFDFGIQYDIHLKNKDNITVGAIFQPEFKADTKKSELSKTISGGYGQVDYDKDTIYYYPDIKGKIVIPYRIGMGFTYYHGNRLMLGAEYEFQKWDRFSVFGNNDSVSDAWTARLGGQYAPKHTVLSPLYKKMIYRFGAHYGLTYLMINNHHLSEFGISVGATFPIRKSRSTFNITVEYGGRGTKQYGLLKENFVNFTFGLSVNQLWFVKRRYQ